MSDPSPYIVSYNFTGFQNNSPTTPLPAPRLDDELLNIATSIASIIDAVTGIRRSDGQLQNGLVTFDSLALAVQLMLDPTNADLVAGAVAAAQAAAVSASGSSVSASASAAAALVSAINAAASAGTVNLALYLPKAGNLAGLGSQSTSRANLGLGTSAVIDVGTAANNILQLDGSAKIPAVDGSLLTNIDVLPIGTTIYVNGTTAPAGCLKENGALVSRATYPRLYAFAAASGNIVTEAQWSSNSSGAFSTGDLSTTFRLPDARGEFIRGYDDGRGVDVRVIGVHQADSLKDHTHTYLVGAFGNQKPNGTGTAPFESNTLTATGSPSTGAATETRPRNNAKLACIKAY